MEKKSNKEFDAYLKKTVREIGLESPSVDFTDTVLSKIAKEAGKSPITDHKPLISMTIWILLGVGLLLIWFLFTSVGFDYRTGWFSNLDVTTPVNFDFLNVFSKIQVSSIFVYAFIGFTFFVGVQVLILKQHFSSRCL